MSKDSPCFGCKERHIGCHATCSKYGSWNAAHKKELAAKRKASVAENAADGYAIDRRKRIKNSMVRSDKR